ncbi:MAG: rho, partial [Blastococcus sp.]|nr:rho [Blastococcus sp.]
MSETTDLVETGAQDASGTSEAPAASGTAGTSRRRGNGLSGMLLPELQRLAGELGIAGTGRMRKGDLVAAISARQVGGAAPAADSARADNDADRGSSNGAPEARGIAVSSAPLEAPISGGANGGPLTAPTSTEGTNGRPRRAARRPAGAPAVDAGTTDSGTTSTGTTSTGTGTTSTGTTDTGTTDTGTTDAESRPDVATSAPADTEQSDGQRTEGDRPQRTRDRNVRTRGDRDGAAREGGDRNDRPANRDGGSRDVANRDGANRDGANRDGGNRDTNRGGRPDNRNDNRADAGRNDNRSDGARTDGPGRNDEDDDDFEGGRGRRGRRYRDRNKRGGAPAGAGRERFDQGEPTVSEDDVLLPVAGILDVLDNYAFVRTSGYLTGPNDVYVSLSQVRRYGLRRGDAITGAVRQPRDGERKDKYNALVRLDTVNGLDPEAARDRPEFTKLTPLYPQERLRLETEPHLLTSRVMDLVMPIGKGQRALIVSPPKAGKTMVLQSIANAITTNNPECHLMVVLVDERPEEVTDMQRSVKGEVIASTFDRPPSDHTTVAELSIERAKRLVEMGHD